MASKTVQRVLDHHGGADWYDPWGSAMDLHFDICEVLDAADVAGDLTPALFAAWQYHRSPVVAVPSLDTLAAEVDDPAGGGGAAHLAVALRDGDISVADLVYTGRVMDTYCRLLELAGKSY